MDMIINKSDSTSESNKPGYKYYPKMFYSPIVCYVDEYCYKNNIPLLRIPYWAYDSLTANDVILGVSPYLYEWEEPEKKEK